MNAYNYINSLNIDKAYKEVKNSTSKEVKSLLEKKEFNLTDFYKLISPSAKKYLEDIVVRAQNITRKRFGNTIKLYVPLYLSNHCQSNCTYCGFSSKNRVKRYTLSLKEVTKELKKIKEMGFDNLLLVTGEAPDIVDIEYLEKVAAVARKYFNSVSIEIYSLDKKGYERLNKAGVEGITIYQETYIKELYNKYHISGIKSDYKKRINTPAKAAKANFRKIGLGILLGLSNWRKDSIYLIHHLYFLMKKYWKVKYSVSFPRINPAVGGVDPKYPVKDWEMLQFMSALRLVFPDIELVLSTRENEKLRDNLIPICITKISAGSKTSPGGYDKKHAEKQFEVFDKRKPTEIKNRLIELGFDPIWKNWDKNIKKMGFFG